LCCCETYFECLATLNWSFLRHDGCTPRTLFSTFFCDGNNPQLLVSTSNDLFFFPENTPHIPVSQVVKLTFLFFFRLNRTLGRYFILPRPKTFTTALQAVCDMALCCVVTVSRASFFYRQTFLGGLTMSESLEDLSFFLRGTLSLPQGLRKTVLFWIFFFLGFDF